MPGKLSTTETPPWNAVNMVMMICLNVVFALVCMMRYKVRKNARKTYIGNIPPKTQYDYVFANEGEAIKFLIRWRVLKIKCPYCKEVKPEMKVQNLVKWKVAWPDDTTSLPHRGCLTLRCSCNSRHCWSPFKGTFFQVTRLPVNKVLEVVYAWSCRMSIMQTAKLTSVDRGTIGQYYKYLREVCIAEVMLMSQYMQLGGVGCVVEMDESKFGKRKYHRGHRVEGNWVWGAIERLFNEKTGKYEAGECVLVVVENRNAETLSALIRKFIRPGSLIISDMWKAYDKIGEWETCGVPALSDSQYEEYFGPYEENIDRDEQNPLRKKMYMHEMVNHSKTFKDPVTGAHTNTIEGHWRVSKDKVPKRVYADSCVLKEYLFEQQWEATRKDVGRFYGILDSLRFAVYEQESRQIILKREHEEAIIVEPVDV